MSPNLLLGLFFGPRILSFYVLFYYLAYFLNVRLLFIADRLRMDALFFTSDYFSSAGGSVDGKILGYVVFNNTYKTYLVVLFERRIFPHNICIMFTVVRRFFLGVLFLEIIQNMLKYMRILNMVSSAQYTILFRSINTCSLRSRLRWANLLTLRFLFPILFK